jgi:hypothetical protein
MAQKFVLTVQAASRDEREELLRALKGAGFEIEVATSRENEPVPASSKFPGPATLAAVMARIFLETDPTGEDLSAFLESSAELAGCPVALFSPGHGRTELTCKAASRAFPEAWTLAQFPADPSAIAFDPVPGAEPLSFPLDGNDLTAGILVASTPGDPVTKGAAPLLETLARALGESAARGVRFRSLDRSLCLMESSIDAMVESCVRLLELRGNETEGHGNRVTALAVRLGERMGLTGRDLVDLRRGALLHDIGKLTLPDSLLQKAGSLTEDDWKTMRSHTVRAHEALRTVGALQGALDIPLCHHERYDGSGYPGGLRGNAIPLAARIFAVVDVWDSLLSGRSYRRSWTPGKALEHLERGAGIQFDPDVVSAFASLMQEEPSLFARPF